MHRSLFRFAVCATIVLTSVPASAFQRGHGGGPKPKPVSQSPKVHAGPKVHAQTPKVHAQGPKMHAGGGGPKVKPVAGPKTRPSASPKMKAAKAPKPAKTTSTTTVTASHKKKGTTSTSTTTTTTTTTTPTLTAVQEKLQRNTNLAGKLSSRLPAGTDLMTAAAGFRNLGQFVAAVNVSNNLGIPFTQLKARMVDDGMSLGQSIKLLRPTADAQVEAQRGETTATLTIRSSEPTMTSTSTSTSTATTSTDTRTTSTDAGKPRPKAKARPRSGDRR